jgi:hypothetical protein
VAGCKGNAYLVTPLGRQDVSNTNCAAHVCAP